MTLKELKNALLQEAVQGKLVPQIASEGNARDLLEEIRKEKVKLVKEKTVKKEKKIAEITDDEIPFDIPETWSWCRITDIASCELGKTKDSQKNKGEFKDYLCSINIQENGIDLSKVKQMKFEKDEIDRYSVQKNDLLICEGGDAGRCAIYPFDTPIFYQNALHRVRFYNDVNPFFYLYVLQLYKANNILMEASKGVTIQHLTGESLRNLCLPLPPLAEQKRIVSALEKFMPLIEEYGKKEPELKAFNEQIGALTKKAILQEAVQGKLVPQIAAEGNAKDLLEEIKKKKSKLIKEGKIKKEKPLPEISEDEIPFDIPESWCWCRLGEIIRVLGGVSYDKKDVTKTGYRILRGGNIQQMKILLDETDVFLPEKYRDEDKLIRKGDILIVASTGSKAVIGKAGFVDLDVSDIMIGAFLRICRPYSLDMAGYLRCLFESDFYRKHIRDLAQGTNINNVKESYITEFVIPLPPLAEQKRIVAAIEKMLPLCAKLGEK